jgi:hypothetical protein
VKFVEPIEKVNNPFVEFNVIVNTCPFAENLVNNSDMNVDEL